MPETMTLVEKTIFLKSIDVVSGIPTEPLAQIAAHAREVHCEPGDVLFREGEEDQGAFIVVEGAIELSKDRVPVRTLEAGMMHGELFLGEQGSHQYTAIARKESRVLNIDRAEVLDALADFPEFGLAMVRAQALLIHRLTERVLELEAKLEASNTPLAPGDREMPALEDPGVGSSDGGDEARTAEGTGGDRTAKRDPLVPPRLRSKSGEGTTQRPT